jgi:hypothetical protein
MDDSSIEELRAEIESFAPPRYREDRRRLFRRLPNDALEFVLRAICAAHSFYRSERASRAAKDAQSERKWYWREREKLEREFERIADHDLVRELPPDAIQYFEPHEVKCPHGDRRKRCQVIRGRLEQLQLLSNPPLSKYVKRRRSELEAELQKAGVDPSTAEPDQFCEPLRRDPSRVQPLSVKPRGGRPPENLQQYLVLAVIERLTEGGVTVEKSCEYLQDILRLCFREKADAAALQRMWYRKRRYEFL